MVKRIGIIGLGNVGWATVASLQKQASIIMSRASLKIQIKGVCDVDKSKRKLVKKFNLPFTTNAYDLINDPEIDIIVELIGGKEPARTFTIDALKKGKHVVTANKALLAANGKEIFALAKKKNKCVGFEASVCGAIPLIKSTSEGLVCCDVKKIYGILNGTTNYILHKMEKEKIDFAVSLKEAKAQGYAEQRADLDVKGIDSLHKLCILSYLCYGIWPSPDKVYAQGISDISLQDIRFCSFFLCPILKNYKVKILNKNRQL